MDKCSMIDCLKPAKARGLCSMHYEHYRTSDTFKPVRVNKSVVGTYLYTAWLNMKGRCQNPNHTLYKYYGGRGIKVCPRWRSGHDGFKRFVQDVGDRPTPQHSIDRIDNDGHYAPYNVHWATKKEQIANRRPLTRRS